MQLTVVISQDVGVSAECERCVQETVKALGGLDILIGNAVGYTLRSVPQHSTKVNGRTGLHEVYL